MTFFKFLMVLVFFLLLAAVALPFGRVTATACGTNHVVTANETLSEIAHNCNISVNDLIAANPQLGDSHQVTPGQTIFVPAGTALSTNNSQVVNNVVVNPNTQTVAQVPVTGAGADPIITVQPGDTLGSLAVKYNTTVQIILSMNPNITNPDRIYVGQQLHVP